MRRAMDPSQFRAEFPVLEHHAYLNAGTDGPAPRRAIDAASARMRFELENGRAGHEHFDAIIALMQRRRELLAGLLAPLAAARDRRAAVIRQAPFAELAGAVTDRTRLVATSHVSWVNGQVVDALGLRATGVPVLLDGAQGIGALPVSVGELGCDFYAASGQKWLCGADGTGCLYVNRERLDDIEPRWYGYSTVVDSAEPLTSPLQPDARRLDLGLLASSSGAWSLAALELFEEAGWDWVHERGTSLSATLADMLAERGHEVQPRGRSTLVSWRDDDCEATSGTLGENGVVVRFLPGRGLVRASVGAWNDESDLERLVALL